MTRCVIDTNVPVVANGSAGNSKGSKRPSVGCRIAAVEFLAKVLAGRKILLDMAGEIQAEYHRYLNPRGQPGVGDRFYLEVLNSSPQRVERCELPKRSDGEFADCPQSLIDTSFDPSDRKFAALANRMKATLYNATDSDWLQHRKTLKAEKIAVKFVCGCDQRFWFDD